MITTLRRLAWLPALALMAAIFFYSRYGQPPANEQTGIPGFDKWTHLLSYGVLAGLIYFALRCAHNLALPRATLLAILLASVYGVTDEWHQSYNPLRNASCSDWLADVAGAALAGYACYRYESRRCRPTNC